MDNRLTAIIKWTVTLCIPFMLAFYVISMVIAPWYPRWEYAKASFPSDNYGWSDAERLELALVAVEYLRAGGDARETIYLLEQQTMPGSDAPLYNQRELDHMVDVKLRTDAIKRLAWILSILVVGGITLLLYRQGTEETAYRALRNGGYTTIGILVGVGIFIAAAWEVFFVQFHELLFPPGSWTFAFTDSLIRLFPNQFWFDVGVVIVVGTLLFGLLISLIGYLLVRRVESEKMS